MKSIFSLLTSKSVENTDLFHRVATSARLECKDGSVHLLKRKPWNSII